MAGALTRMLALTAETLWGVVWAVVLCAAGLFVGTRTFRRQNA